MFDVAFTSVLKRAIRTLWIVLDEMDLMWIPVHALVASERAALRRVAGAEQGGDGGQVWRRAGARLAAQLRCAAARAGEPTIRAGPATIRATRIWMPADLPLTECLKDTVARFLPYWHEIIAPAIRVRQARDHRRARQQPARAGQVPGRYLR